MYPMEPCFESLSCTKKIFITFLVKRTTKDYVKFNPCKQLPRVEVNGKLKVTSLRKIAFV